MSTAKENAQQKTTIELPRRAFIFDSARTALSATAVALLGGYASLGKAAGAEQPADTANDVSILTEALSAEREAVAAYQLGAESGLLHPGVLKVALQFQGHHEKHGDLLASAISDFGGRVPTSVTDYSFPTDSLKQQKDVLAFAASLERSAVSAYVGAIPLFINRDLSKAAASILADEAMHWAVLRQALGLAPVPGAFFS